MRRGAGAAQCGATDAGAVSERQRERELPLPAEPDRPDGLVGVGSVGTRCYVSALVDGDGSVLLMQTKEAGRSVLIEHGACAQPSQVAQYIAEQGEGGRVVAMQRILRPVPGVVPRHAIAWANAYAELSRGDYDAFLARGGRS